MPCTAWACAAAAAAGWLSAAAPHWCLHAGTLPGAELCAKQANMKELVCLAEVREARAKEEVARLVEEREGILNTSGESARALGAAFEQQQQQQQVQAAEPDAGAAAAGGEEPASPAGSSSQQQGDAAAERAAAEPARLAPFAPAQQAAQLAEERAASIAEAKARKQAAKEQFSRLSQVCVAAHQVRKGCMLACIDGGMAKPPGCI